MPQGSRRVHRLAWVWLTALSWCVSAEVCPVVASDVAASRPGKRRATIAPDVLTPERQEAVDRSIDRAIAWLAGRQQPDGSFRAQRMTQPAVSSLCLLAFLARGHLPGKGPDGRHVEAGVDFVVSCQKPSGLLSYFPAEYRAGGESASALANYNNAISGLLLAEVCGMVDGDRAARVRAAIKRAIQFSRARQLAPKRLAHDRGGWRYLHRLDQMDSDLCVTSWHLLFWRAAKNAGFEIPPEWLDEAVAYVMRCFDRKERTFVYGIRPADKVSRAMAGAGILSVVMAGKHDAPEVRAAGDWLLKYPLDQYNVPRFRRDEYHYAAFYCSQAMFQLGGRYWVTFYPPLARTLLAGQTPQGCWSPESDTGDGQYGKAYTTALSVLALATPYQLLPIYQR